MPSTPEPLPSLPPSPVEEPTPKTRRHEEDVGRAWHDDEPDARARINAARKGKGRARRNGKRPATGSGDDDDDDEEDEDENEDSAALEGYPPTKEEEAESRRVQEVRHPVLVSYMPFLPSDGGHTSLCFGPAPGERLTATRTEPPPVGSH